MTLSLLEKVSEITDNNELCFPCLGRLFGELGHGLTNRERGRALFRSLMMKKDCSLQGLGEGRKDCEVCGGLYDEMDKWAEKGKEKLESFEFDTFLVGNRMKEKVLKCQEDLEKRYNLKNSEPPGREFNREVGKGIFWLLKSEGREVDVNLEDPHLHIVFDLNEETLSLQVKPVYIYGRYKKFSRNLPQSPWHCPSCRGQGCEECGFTGRVYSDSIAELIGVPIQESLQGEEFQFHGAGREDVDAKMLGSGRPFVTEVTVPKSRSLDPEKVSRTVNTRGEGRIDVSNLRKVHKDIVEDIKETRIDKSYRVIVESSRKIGEKDFKEALADLIGEIKQRTPKRVNHRRTDKYRFREVKRASGKRVGKRKFEAELRCSSGLYVKELISSDGGRTEPSLSGILGVEVSARELDVTGVFGKLIKEKGDWEFVKGDPDG